MAEALKTWSVYVLRDPRNNAVRYVGVTINVRKRLSSHLRTKDGTPRGLWIQELLAANLAPLIEVVETGDDSGHETAEKRWISQFRADGCDLTNTTDGGNGTVGYTFTPEVRAKMGAAMKGKKHGPEWIAKSAAGHRALNRKLSDEHKAIVGRTHKGVSFMTPEGRQRVREYARNRVVSEETRAKISKLHKGRVVSEETRAKLSSSASGYEHSPEAREKMRMAWEKRRSEHSSFPERGDKMRMIWAKRKLERSSFPEFSRKGVTMPCGWCGEPQTATSIRKHFVGCPKRPDRQARVVK